MKKILSLVLALMLLAAACGDDGDTTAGADDADGEDITNDEETGGEEVDDEPDAAEDDQSGDDPAGPAGPERIVSLSATATESLFAIGAGDLLVAVDNFSNYPANDLPTIDSFSPSVEGIAEFEPDLVVITFDPGDLVSGLDALGIATITQGTAVSIEDAYAQISQLGEATGFGSEAGDVVEDIQSQLDELVAGAPDGAGISYYHELDDTFYSITSQTFAGEIYSLFALDNVADPADDGTAFGYPQLSDEYLVDTDPDLIFLADTICCGQNAGTVAERPGWDQLSAVQNGNVIELSDDVASRWGPRIVDFAEAIATALAGLS